jgi:hypothetical protein
MGQVVLLLGPQMPLDVQLERIKKASCDTSLAPREIRVGILRTQESRGGLLTGLRLAFLLGGTQPQQLTLVAAQ